MQIPVEKKANKGDRFNKNLNKLEQYNMRIYAVADIHGRQNRYSMIQEKVSSHHADILVVAGDITNYFRPYPVIERLNNFSIPVLAVRGNSDRAVVESLFNAFDNITSLNLKEISLNGVPFTGISGTIPVPFCTRIGLRERQIKNKILQLVTPDSVLVVHPPPWGVLDRVLNKFHAGSRSIKDIIIKKQPRLVLCGHIHEDPGIAYINQTLVINCSIGKSGAGVLIELRDNEKPKVVFL